MAVDIYIVPSSESGYSPNKIEETDELKIYLGQIRMVLNTDIGSVCGASEMGLDLESRIFDMGMDEAQLKEAISMQILSFCTYSNKFKTDVNVKFATGPKRDICFIDFIIDNTKQMQFRIF